MSQFATANELRDFMEITGTTGRKSTDNLNIILSASSDWLERTTGRIITASGSNVQRVISTNGEASVVIPDLRLVSSVTLQGAALVADSNYWLLPSRQAPDIYTGVQLRGWGQRGSWVGNPEWFDRNLDQPLVQAYGRLPNDLKITGLWGWTSTPPQWKLATLVLGAYTFHHGDALFANARATPEGNLLDLSSFPTEVQALIRDWSISAEVALV